MIKGSRSEKVEKKRIKKGGSRDQRGKIEGP